MNRSPDWTIMGERTMKVATGAGEDPGVVTLNPDTDGLIERWDAPSRMYAAKGQMMPLPWHGRFWDCQKLGGKFLPLQGKIAWTINGKKFAHSRGQILNWQPAV